MRMFEINDEIESCIDMETGEILDPEKLANLQIERHKKLRAYAFYHLQAKLDAKNADELMKAYAAKKKGALKRADFFKELLDAELKGATMKEPEFTVSYRKSESVEVGDMKSIPDEFLIPVEPKPDKVAIKKALKNGAVIEGVELIEKKNIQIATPRVPKE